MVRFIQHYYPLSARHKTAFYDILLTASTQIKSSHVLYSTVPKNGAHYIYYMLSKYYSGYISRMLREP